MLKRFSRAWLAVCFTSCAVRFERTTGIFVIAIDIGADVCEVGGLLRYLATANEPSVSEKPIRAISKALKKPYVSH